MSASTIGGTASPAAESEGLPAARGPDPEAELAGHTAREELETKKLRAEIQHIESQIEENARTARLANKTRIQEAIRGWLGLATALVSVIVAIFTISHKAAEFLDQQKREHQFTVTMEMVELVRQLSAEAPGAREDAAILLSAFKEDAIPVLLNNLTRVEDPIATIESLELIKRGEQRSPSEVTEFLLDASDELFTTIPLDEPGSITPLGNFLQALRVLAADDTSGTITSLKKLKDRVEKLPCEHQLRAALDLEIEDLLNALLPSGRLPEESGRACP